MKESIKKQPPDWKKIVLLIAVWLALAALGGLVAAAVFAVTEPKIAEAVTREEPPAKVDIPGDEDRIQTADRSRMRQLPHLRRVRR